MTPQDYCARCQDANRQASMMLTLVLVAMAMFVGFLLGCIVML